jgi:hemolysin III
MRTIPVRGDRPRTRGEEAANSVSHGLALLAAVAAVPWLMVAAVRSGRAAAVVTVAIYCAAIVLVFAASTLYHTAPEGRVKRAFEMVDRTAIYLMIAGTYTPFSVVVLRGAWGWALLAAVWALAVFGILVTVCGRLRFPILSIGIYLTMGWLVLFALGPLMSRLPVPGVQLLLVGGVAYTVGVAFYALRAVPYHHLVWHVLVMMGAACHVLAVFWYVT